MGLNTAFDVRTLTDRFAYRPLTLSELIIATKLASAWTSAKTAFANAFATPVVVRATVA